MIILLTFSVFSKQKVRILTWWDFISPKVLQGLENNGFDISITEYRSNEVALSKILTKPGDYDVVIISNWVMKILEKTEVIDRTLLKKIGNERNYHYFLKQIVDEFDCLPYLWATTSYAMDTRGQLPEPMDLVKLVGLKKHGYKIGIIDDAVEFGAAVMLSYDPTCVNSLAPHELFFGMVRCNFPEAKVLSSLFKPADFRNSIQTLVGPKTAVYGWHGELGKIINKFSYMNFVKPAHSPVVGLDSVCLIRNKKNQLKLVEFAKEITGKKMTKINAENMQYFSPYVDLKPNYNFKINLLYEDTVKSIRSSNPIILQPPEPLLQEKLNQWWQKLRYEKG